MSRYQSRQASNSDNTGLTTTTLLMIGAAVYSLRDPFDRSMNARRYVNPTTDSNKAAENIADKPRL